MSTAVLLGILLAIIILLIRVTVRLDREIEKTFPSDHMHPVHEEIQKNFKRTSTIGFWMLIIIAGIFLAVIKSGG